MFGLDPSWPHPSPRQRIISTLVKAYRGGATLRFSAQLAGVHVATVCRWQKTDPKLRQALQEARQHKQEQRQEPRPQVPWHKSCPECKAKVVVKTARNGTRFWRCGRWPACAWASWRPRAPRNCYKCKSPRYWSHSRRSIVCSGCGLRTMAP